jgi:tRNA(fMet)-specific endonuclease VapC
VSLIFLLDSNVWGTFLNQKSQRLVAKFHEHPPSSIALCSIVIEEFQFGWRMANWGTRRIAEQERVLRQFHSLPYDDNAARIAGDIRAFLDKRGERIGARDSQIAAVAMANDLKVVTHNVSEFSRIPGLQWEDWEV